MTHLLALGGMILISVVQDQVRLGGPEVCGLTLGQTWVNGH